MKKFLVILASASLLVGCSYQAQQPQRPPYPYGSAASIPPSPTPRPTPAPVLTPVRKAPKSTVINLDRPILFGAAWCTPCQKLHTDLDNKGIRAGVQYDYVDIDTQLSSVTPISIRNKAKAYVDKHGIPAVMDRNGNMSHGNNILNVF